MRKFIPFFIFISFSTFLLAQETFPVNGVKDQRPGKLALTHVTLAVNHLVTLIDATLLVNNGKIENIGVNIDIPKGYKVLDRSGLFIYPSLIDLHSQYGLPKKESSRHGGYNSAEQILPITNGAHSSNDAIKAHYNAVEAFNIQEKAAKKYRNMGFGAVLSFREDGLARGTSVLVSLATQSNNKVVLIDRAAAHYSLSRGTSKQSYPRSMMGYVSLLRQTYLNASWYKNQSPKPFSDLSLEAWISQQELPQMFYAGSWKNALRAGKIAREFDVHYIIETGGDSYQRIREIKALKSPIIVPINFPDAYDVEDAYDAERVSLKDMKHWEMAPSNISVLLKNNIQFAITSRGLKGGKDFFKNIRLAMKYGVSADEILKALTITPAKLLGVEDRLGTLEEGKMANFIVTSGPLFDEKTIIYENWIQGIPYKINDFKGMDYSGKYDLSIDGQLFPLEISGKPGAHKAKIVIDDSTSIKVKAAFDKQLISLSFKPSKETTSYVRLSGWYRDSVWQGKGQNIAGDWVSWSAKKTGNLEKQEKKDFKKTEKSSTEVGDVFFPFTAFGRSSLPVASKILIKNATVWTNEIQGIMSNTDVFIKSGKIALIGQNLSVDSDTIIDGSNKHLTAGIIDEHTHIAGGGNDVATNSSMVRIEDQLNTEDINIYRALAGGVTAVQVLHGSANPIGGQSALIKLRWGESPENMKIAGADRFIKFALGENVKRSRKQNSIRYPQTRMGVEQVYVDAFTNALEYEKKWVKYGNLSASVQKQTAAPRRDLVHEAMLDIIHKNMFITCHSYVQSEINMLMKVAERFHFNINTFTHILEGYKVADKMKKHGAGASSFSDWWNYKWEVRYAIPYNAAIMHYEGVITAINSDNADMGRRLNQEAAKSIKYGGVSEQDALKMVTLNPAKLLHLDARMGSIKVGKDADVVLWTDHPLSVYAKAEVTIIDGKIYYSIRKDLEMRKSLLSERNRLIQKMKLAKKSGHPTQKPPSKHKLEYTCGHEFHRE